MATSSIRTPADLAALIDHTLLKPEATPSDVRKLCDEARQHNFASVCVSSVYVLLAAELLHGTRVNPIAVVGFPLGNSTSLVKAFEATEAANHGAREIDMVLHIGSLKAGDLAHVKDDMCSVIESVQPLPVKVILETALLTPDEIATACKLACECGAAFVKTSTGFGPGGATVEAVELMRRTVGPDVGVKASGGIRSHVDAMKMVAAGANRLGTSASVAIVTAEQAAQGNY